MDVEALIPLPSDFEVHDFRVRAMVSAIQSPELRPVAQAFADNVFNIRSLLSLPIMMLLGREAIKQAANDLFKSLESVTHAGKDLTPLALDDLRVTFLNDHAAMFMDEESRMRLNEGAKESFAQARSNPAVEPAYRALLTTATTLAWTTFECVATDARHFWPHKGAA